MEKMRATTNGHDHQRMIEETDMGAKACCHIVADGVTSNHYLLDDEIQVPEYF
jgi:hypothetical protein